VVTSVVGADTLDQFLGRQEPCGFQNRPLPMDPAWLNGVEPGTLAGQWTHDQATASLTLDTLVVGFEPFSDHFVEMPGRIVPDQESCLVAVMGEACGDPGQIIAGDLADGAPVNKTQQHGSVCGKKSP
jgi:hypothetical protein